MENKEIKKALKKYHLDNDLGLSEFKRQKQKKLELKKLAEKPQQEKLSMLYFEDGYKIRNRPPFMAKKPKLIKHVTSVSS